MPRFDVIVPRAIRPLCISLPVGVAFATAALFGAAGCGDETTSADTASTVVRPQSASSTRLVVLPRIGELRWRCESTSDGARFGMRLAVSPSDATVVGAVGLGGRSREVRVDPGEEFDTGLTSSASQRWTLAYRHAPATIRVHLNVEFGVEGAAGDCVVRDLRLRQRTERP